MLQTVEAVIDEKGVLKILDAIELPKKRRVIVTILNEEPTQEALEQASRSKNIAVMEQRHANGYRAHPQIQNEIAEWESEQNWEKP